MNEEEWDPLLMCEVFVLLAVSTPFNVLGSPLVHPWPPVGQEDFPNGFVSSWVACDQSAMVVMEDVPFYLFIWGYD